MACPVGVKNSLHRVLARLVGPGRSLCGERVDRREHHDILTVAPPRSSSGLGRRVLIPVTGVRVPYGVFSTTIDLRLIPQAGCSRRGGGPVTAVPCDPLSPSLGAGSSSCRFDSQPDHPVSAFHRREPITKSAQVLLSPEVSDRSGGRLSWPVKNRLPAIYRVMDLAPRLVGGQFSARA